MVLRFSWDVGKLVWLMAPREITQQPAAASAARKHRTAAALTCACCCCCYSTLQLLQLQPMMMLDCQSLLESFLGADACG